MENVHGGFGFPPALPAASSAAANVAACAVRLIRDAARSWRRGGEMLVGLERAKGNFHKKALRTVGGFGLGL